MRALLRQAYPLFLLGLLGLFLLAPIGSVLYAGLFEDGGDAFFWLKEVAYDRLYRTGIINSLLLAACVTALTLAISWPLAMIADRCHFAGRTFWLAAIQVPLILPPFVGALGLKGLLSRNGGINAFLVQVGVIDPAHPIDWLANPFATCVVLEALYLYPITFLNIQAALANIDPSLREAARDLGAGPWRQFLRVTYPLAQPGVFAGATLVFIWALTELGTPLMVGYRSLAAVQVFDALQTTHPEGDAYALTCYLLGASILAYLGGRVLFRNNTIAMQTKGGGAREEQRAGLLRSALLSVPFAIVTLLAVLPHIGVILLSLSKSGTITLSLDELTLDHYRHLLAGFSPTSSNLAARMAATSIANSGLYAGLATIASLWLGLSIAYLAVRRRSALSRLLDTLAMLPLAVPGLVMAFGYFAITQTAALSFLNPLKHNPMPLLVIAYTVRRLPFIVRSCAAGLEQVAVATEEAAMDLGAGFLRTLRSVTIPLILPNLIAGAFLVFSRSMLEVSDSLILAFSRDSYPMTKAIWAIEAIPQNGVQIASALGVVGMVILTVAMASASIVLGAKLGSLFRV